MLLLGFDLLCEGENEKPIYYITKIMYNSSN